MNEIPEKTAISRVVAFANMSDVDSVERVYKLFEPATKLPIRLAVIRESPDGKWDLQEVGGVRTEMLDGELLTPQRELELIREWQHATKAMLGQIVRKRPVDARREFGKQFTTALQRGVMVGIARFNGKVLAQNSRFDGPINSQVAFGIALLLDVELPFTKMLRRCRWDSCRAFFLHENKGRPKYCPACRDPKSPVMRDFAAKRARRYRRKP